MRSKCNVLQTVVVFAYLFMVSTGCVMRPTDPQLALKYDIVQKKRSLYGWRNLYEAESASGKITINMAYLGYDKKNWEDIHFEELPTGIWIRIFQKINKIAQNNRNEILPSKENPWLLLKGQEFSSLIPFLKESELWRIVGKFLDEQFETKRDDFREGNYNFIRVEIGSLPTDSVFYFKPDRDEQGKYNRISFEAFGSRSAEVYQKLHGGKDDLFRINFLFDTQGNMLKDS